MSLLDGMKDFKSLSFRLFPVEPHEDINLRKTGCAAVLSVMSAVKQDVDILNNYCRFWFKVHLFK